MQHVDHSAGDLIDLLQGLLRYDPDERLKARQALQHPFFTRSHRRCGYWDYTEIEILNSVFVPFDV
jgi:dual-specificity kinase